MILNIKPIFQNNKPFNITINFQYPKFLKNPTTLKPLSLPVFIAEISTTENCEHGNTQVSNNEYTVRHSMQREYKSLGWGRKRNWTKDRTLQQKRYPVIWQLIADEQVQTMKKITEMHFMTTLMQKDNLLRKSLHTATIPSNIQQQQTRKRKTMQNKNKKEN